MKKIIFIQSLIDDSQKPNIKMSDALASFFINSLPKEILREFEVSSLSENLKYGGVPRGYDAYLIHPQDVNIKDIRELKREQPNSLFYCLHRWKENAKEEEREAYDYFTFMVDTEDLNKIARQIRGEND